MEGKGSSKHLEMYTETYDQSENDEHVKTCLETPCESGSSKHSNSETPCESGSGKHSNSETPCESGSSKHSNSKPEVTDESRSCMGSEIDVIARDEGALESDNSNCSNTHASGTGSILDPPRSSSSSSSLESSLNDVFEVETVKLESEVSRPATKDEQNDDPSHSSPISEVDKDSPVPASTCLPSTVSPPVQVMDTSGGYDPQRIPSSIFAKNTSAMDWSIASNESLFSIHIGNNSFSQDHAFVFSELYKSGELTKSGELCMFSPPPFVIPEDIEIDKQSVDMEDLEEDKTSEEACESEERISEDQNKVKNSHPDINWNSCNVSGHSHCSGTSACSFAFPILTEGERNSSVKTDIPQRQSVEEPSDTQKEDASEVSPHSTAKCCSWFRCFSWCSCWPWGKCCPCRC